MQFLVQLVQRRQREELLTGARQEGRHEATGVNFVVKKINVKHENKVVKLPKGLTKNMLKTFQMRFMFSRMVLMKRTLYGKLLEIKATKELAEFLLIKKNS